MSSKAKHFPSFSIVQGDVEIKVDMGRFEKQFQRAQYMLDSSIMNSMKPYMPHGAGMLVDNTVAQSGALAGTGVVIAAAPPYGRYLYEGKLMVDEKTGSPWARKGAKKVLLGKYSGKADVSERKPDLTYSNPKAQPHWFDVAKAKDGKNWVDTVKRIAGGG